MKPLSDALLLEWADEPNGHVRLTVVAEKCDGCNERVHYWNDETGTEGFAACGCTIEGPEDCARPIPMYGGILTLLSVALVQTGIDSRKRDEAGNPVGDLRKTFEEKFAKALHMSRAENLAAHELAESVLSTIDAWTGIQMLDATAKAAREAARDAGLPGTEEDPPAAQLVYEKLRLHSLELEHQHSKTVLRTLHHMLSAPVEIPRSSLLEILDMSLKYAAKIDEMDRVAKGLSKEIP